MKEFGEFLAVLVLGMIVGFAMAFAIAALLHWGVPPLWLAIFVGGASLAVVANDLRKEIR